MSVVTCKRCDTVYWRYRRDHPPPSFCSIGCKEVFALDHPQQEARPDEPAVVIRRIREHNRVMHEASSDMLDWDCKACERLQGEYAASLAFHTKFAPEAAC